MNIKKTKSIKIQSSKTLKMIEPNKTLKLIKLNLSKN
jgi:hypothetical protein